MLCVTVIKIIVSGWSKQRHESASDGLWYNQSTLTHLRGETAM